MRVVVVFAFFFLLVRSISCFAAQGAEEKLDEIFHQLASDDKFLASLIMQPVLSKQQKRESDRFFTEALLNAWRERKRLECHEERGEYDSLHDLCGLDYNFFFCAQDIPDFPVFYEIHQIDQGGAIISVAWEEGKETVAFYKMLQDSGTWKVDGISCSLGDVFHYKEYLPLRTQYKQ